MSVRAPDMPPEPAWVAAVRDEKHVVLARFRSTLFPHLAPQKNEQRVRDLELETLGAPAALHAAPTSAIFHFRFAAPPRAVGQGWAWDDVEVRHTPTKGGLGLYARRPLEPGVMIPFLGKRVPPGVGADFFFAEDGFGVQAHADAQGDVPAVCAGGRCAAAYVNEPGRDERECINCFFGTLYTDGLYEVAGFHSPCVFLIVAMPIAQGDELIAWYDDTYGDEGPRGVARAYFAPERYKDEQDFQRRVREVSSVLALVAPDRCHDALRGAVLRRRTIPPARPFDVYAVGLLQPRDYGFRVNGDCFYEAFAFALRDTGVLAALGLPRDPPPRGSWTQPLRHQAADKLSHMLYQRVQQGLPFPLPESAPPGLEPEEYIRQVREGKDYADHASILALLEHYPSVGLAIVRGHSNANILAAGALGGVQYFVMLHLSGEHYKNLPVHVPGEPKPLLVLQSNATQTAFEALEQIPEFRPSPRRSVGALR